MVVLYHILDRDLFYICNKFQNHRPENTENVHPLPRPWRLIEIAWALQG